MYTSDDIIFPVRISIMFKDKVAGANDTESSDDKCYSKPFNELKASM